MYIEYVWRNGHTAFYHAPSAACKRRLRTMLRRPEVKDDDPELLALIKAISKEK